MNITGTLGSISGAVTGAIDTVTDAIDTVTDTIDNITGSLDDLLDDFNGTISGLFTGSEIDEQIATLKQTPDQVNQSVVYYPADIISTQELSYMVFKINEMTDVSNNTTSNQQFNNNNNISQTILNQIGTVNNDGRFTGIRKETKGMIALSMPEDITFTYGVAWNVDELGLAGNVVNAMNNGMSIEDFTYAGSEMLSKMGYKMAQNVTGANFEGAYEVSNGKIMNPHMQVLFQGVSNRSFPMSIIFTPRDENEAASVREIIRRFKYHSHPDVSGVSGYSQMTYPGSFEIFFMDGNKLNKNLPHFKQLVLTSISESHSAGGEYARLQNGESAVIQLDLTFTEIDVLTKNDFDYNASGVLR